MQALGLARGRCASHRVLPEGSSMASDSIMAIIIFHLFLFNVHMCLAANLIVLER